ncbi:unnamed protein product [Rhizophagus irregularis]|nr:unnamed protein product [Rhizophagus irregularis]
MRPKIVPGIHLEYKKLMEQCWDADSTKRPNACTLIKEVHRLLKFQNYQDDSQKQIISDQNKQLKEQEAFHSKSYIPNNVDGFNNLSNEKMLTQNQVNIKKSIQLMVSESY